VLPRSVWPGTCRVAVKKMLDTGGPPYVALGALALLL
jgi:hypothetical protein